MNKAVIRGIMYDDEKLDWLGIFVRINETNITKTIVKRIEGISFSLEKIFFHFLSFDKKAISHFSFLKKKKNGHKVLGTFRVAFITLD